MLLDFMAGLIDVVAREIVIYPRRITHVAPKDAGPAWSAMESDYRCTHGSPPSSLMVSFVPTAAPDSAKTYCSFNTL